MTQARSKLKYEAFTELNQILLDDHYKSAICKSWQHGHRIIAVDGSTLEIPKSEETAKYFGLFKPNKEDCIKKTVMARVNLAYDIYNEMIVSANLFPFRTGESDQALTHLDKLSTNDILLMDRGFDGFWLMTLLKGRGMNFVIRMKTGAWRKVKTMIRKGEKDIITCLHAGNKAILNCKERDLSTMPVRVRLIHQKLKNGQDIVLATTLMDQRKYPADAIIKLYSMRWKIEERIKFLKERLEVAAFTGKSILSAYQDFHAKILLANYSSVITNYAQADLTHNKNMYQLNKTRAVARIKDFIVEMFNGWNIRKKLQHLLSDILKSIEKIKPDRTFPRSHYPPMKYHVCYKPA